MKAVKALLLVFLGCVSWNAFAEAPFPRWLAEFKKEALKKGISEKTLGVMDQAELLPQVLDLDRKQPETTLTFEQYQSRVVKPERVAEGKRLLSLHRAELEKASARFGVEPEFITALWGVETHFGTRMGDFSIVSALTTLAYDGRRARFFREQLLDALRILERGDVEPKALKGSWAGAMGNCQFMPGTFLRYAVDMDGDGRRDLWTSLPDVFGSAANYLSRVGWKRGRGWGEPVRVPPNFDVTLLSRKVKKSRSEWKALGVQRADGTPLEEGPAQVSLIRPGGKSEKLFLVQGNYPVLLRWNNSEYFATVVSLLAEALATPSAPEAKATAP